MKSSGKKYADPRTYTVVARDGVIYTSSLLIAKLMRESHDDTLERILNAKQEWQRETPRCYFQMALDWRLSI